MIREIKKYSSSNDIKNIGEIAIAIKDLNDVRLTKLKNSTDYLIENKEPYANVNKFLTN